MKIIIDGNYIIARNNKWVLIKGEESIRVDFPFKEHKGKFS